MRLKLIVYHSFHGHNFVRLKAKQSGRRQWCPYHLRVWPYRKIRAPSPPPRTGNPVSSSITHLEEVILTSREEPSNLSLHRS